MKKIVVGDCFDTIDGGPAICVGLVDGTNWPWVEYCGTKYRLNPETYPPIPTLHLPIGNDQKRHGGKWFGMILSGEKTEEYREIKEYNGTRLVSNWNEKPLPGLISSDIWEFKPLKVIHLTNGYGHHRPQLWAHITEITIGNGNPEWGAPDHDVFIIKLGEVFHTKNLKVVN